MGSVLLEALIVSTLGLALALAANSWRADGLQLDRDYFPREQLSAAATPAAVPDSPVAADPTAATPPGAATEDAATEDAVTEGAATEGAATAALALEIEPAVAARLAEKGLSAVSHGEALALWRDPMFQEYEATVFLDARRAEQYDEGHIPGALHFDPFYPERTIDALLQRLPSAMTIVIYCKGGECDDSESAALYLINLGAVDPSRLSIYAGGMEAWRAAELPLEQGPRGSGAVSKDDDG